MMSNRVRDEETIVSRPTQEYGAFQSTDSIDESPFGDTAKISKTYKRRFYIVGMFSFFTMVQAGVWNTWGPVAHTATVVFGWDNTTLALMPNWGNFLFVITFIVMVKMLLRFGLRLTTLFSTFVLALGTAIRCIPSTILIRTLAAHTCAIIISFAGTLAMIGPTVLSVTWFPPHQRTTATAMITLSNNNLAFAFSFLFPNLFITDRNVSEYANETIREEVISDMGRQLDHFLYAEAIICACIFLCILLYFPNKPPTPPSSTAVIKRVQFLPGTISAFKLRNFWLIMLPTCVPLGILPGFMSVLAVLLQPYGITQIASDWIGLYCSLTGIVGGLFFSRLADCLRNRTKLCLVITMIGNLLCFGTFALYTYNVIPSNIGIVYGTLIAGGFFGYGSIPLFYELACELTYPISEEVISGLLTAFASVALLLFLAFVMIKQIGTLWVSPCLAVSCLISVPLLLGIREQYYRLDVDIAGAGEVTDSDEKVLMSNS